MYKSTLPDVKGRNYEVVDVVRTFVEADDYCGDVCEMLDNGIKDLEQQAKKKDADGVIGITMVSASTKSNTYGKPYPDAIVYGTAIKFTD